LEMNLCEAIQGEKDFIKEREKLALNLERVNSG